MTTKIIKVPPAILIASSKSPAAAFQDEKYGKGMRVCNQKVNGDWVECITGKVVESKK